MIGVISKPDQATVVEEFFELFKTPWEYYEPTRGYDVVVATADEIPEVNARLLVVYGAGTKNTDARNGIAANSRHEGGLLECAETALPIYDRLATFRAEGKNVPCLQATIGVAGMRVGSMKGIAVLRIGYDLFQEVQFLLSAGQPVENARIPTLDIHIGMLRNWILGEGIPLLEIPPFPAGHAFMVCLTHDIDFVGIRDHKFDHTMWGFLHRSTVGAIRNFFRGRVSLRRLFQTWRAVALLPLVFIGWVKDFWSPFEWYLQVEKNLPATYFLIPFKRRMGEHVPGSHAAWRATAYDVEDIRNWAATLEREGCELGVHGIDAWHSVEKGREELSRLNKATDKPVRGIRMHWLLQDRSTLALLDKAGYAYDSTSGYNETIGYRNGTTQIFRPLDAKILLELPMHIQDGALFYHDRLDLTDLEAEKRCKDLIENAGQYGGVLTVLWHDRSHAAERFWGDFYISLVQVLKSSDAWFATAAEAVGWFQKRRDVRFERVEIAGKTTTRLYYEGEEIRPQLNIRAYGASRRNTEAQWPVEEPLDFVDATWDGHSLNELELQSVLRVSGIVSNFVRASHT